MTPQDVAVMDRRAFPERLEDEVFRPVGSHQLEAFRCSFPAPVDLHFRALESVNPSNDGRRDADCRGAGDGFGDAPVTAAEALVDRNCILVNVFPLQTEQFAYSQPRKDGDLDHRRVGLAYEANELRKLIRSDMGLLFFLVDHL
jgi:hypothetical protein